MSEQDSNKSSIRRPLKIPGKRFVLTKRVIENAIEVTRSNAEAARWLGVSYNTYKKWSKYYGIFDKNLNQSGKGISRVRLNTKYPLDDILNNEHPDYSDKLLRKRLVDSGYMDDECGVCGWNEGRVTDNKICLTLDYLDGNKSNKSFENLRLICPNCYFTNVGDFKNSKKFC